jgi:hypothetical protein
MKLAQPDRGGFVYCAWKSNGLNDGGQLFGGPERIATNHEAAMKAGLVSAT